jgi:predicted GNAT superfamily acetyltransferase
VAGGEAVIEIRQLFQHAEFEDVVRLQKSIWSFADSELLPVRFLVVVSKVGGHVFGAYEGGEMVGFCFAIPGIKSSGRSYLHSHMLGVVPGYQNAGIGRKLKLRQRDEAIGRGIELIEWTFDPMELKNAFLNIERLGVIVRRYHENQYGVTASPLHGGLPTDRCYAEWWISSERVKGRLDTGSADSHKLKLAATRISYPADIGKTRKDNPQRAREIQQENGEKFRKAFAEGLAVTAFERSETEGTYILEPWQ